MIQLTQNGVKVDHEGISALREEYNQTGIARIPGLLRGDVLVHLMKWLDDTQMVERQEVSEDGEVFGTTAFVPVDTPCFFLFQFIVNRPGLYKAVEEITACGAIANFVGRLHRTVAGGNQHIDWHSDAKPNLKRMVGLCINLTRDEYSGGEFQIRDEHTHLRAKVPQIPAGDAFLFRIDNAWEHRLTPITHGSRTVGVGWFRSEPKWHTANHFDKPLPAFFSAADGGY